MKLKEKVVISIGVLFAIFCIGLIVYILSKESSSEWFSKSASKLTAGDIIIIVILHAVLNRTEIKLSKQDNH